jgi:outer membrane lipoprotein-sorting protein
MTRKLRLSGLLFGAALLATTSCGQLKIPGASSATSSGPVQASDDPREALKKAFTAQRAARTYRARLEYSIGGVGTHNDLEFVAPDRYHVTLVGPAAMGQEMIIIGNDKFARISGRPWAKTDMNVAAGTMATTLGDLTDQFHQEDVSQRMTKYDDVQFSGSEVLEGQPVVVYQFNLKSKKGPIPGKIWISTADNLPRKIVHEAGSQTNSDRKMKLSTTYYDYNANIKIEPPI